MIPFYISESFMSFKRARLASIITLITTVVAIALTSFSIVLLFLSSEIDYKLKSSLEISLYLDDSLSSKEISSIKSSLQNDPGLRSVKFISKDDALKQFVEETGEDFRSVLDVNPLPASFAVRLNPGMVSKAYIDSIATNLLSYNGINDVVYDYTLIMRILNVLESGKTIILIASILLIMLAIYLVYSNNRLLIHMRKDQFNTMKLVGTKLITLKIPIYLNGIILGLLAALLCIILFNISFYVLTRIYYSINFNILVFYMNGLILLIGLFLGLLGSWLSTRTLNLHIER